tara:strand:- start:553 stop:726 length:174 start_codon:yes stop_codon:yes gene_type:complete
MEREQKKDNKKILLDIQDDLYKMKQDISIIKLDVKVILAKLELSNPKPQPISKGWFF